MLALEIAAFRLEGPAIERLFTKKAVFELLLGLLGPLVKLFMAVKFLSLKAEVLLTRCRVVLAIVGYLAAVLF